MDSVKEKTIDEIDYIKTNGKCLLGKIAETINNNNGYNKNNNINNNNNSSNEKLLNHFENNNHNTNSITISKNLSALEKLHLFNSFPTRKKSDSAINSNNSLTKEKPKFVKSASIARLFGNNYSTKKNETNQLILQKNIIKKNTDNSCNSNNSSSSNNNKNTINLNYKIQVERFYQKTKCDLSNDDNLIDDSDSTTNSNNSHNNSSNISSSSDSINVNVDQDMRLRKIWTLSRGLGNLLRRRTSSINISDPDPEFKVAYLGNVLTGWAKGDGCVDKPLATLWRNYSQNSKPNVAMKIRVCSSGLKATTKQHGITEYWSHRITHCVSPKNYPRVFCWVYRHEGRKLKHEMRCHAVLCSKESIAQEIGKKLQENIARALCEFKRDKISRQNARLSLVNSVYENPSMPRRKILLSVGGNNYRPPLERSKSAPKLMAIEEIIDEEEEEEDCEENKNKNYCKEDAIYSAMTLGRRRCRRNSLIKRRNSIRRSLKKSELKHESSTTTLRKTSEPLLKTNDSEEDITNILEPLEGEIMSYFDMKINTNSTSLLNLSQNQINENIIRNSQSLDDIDQRENDDDDDFFLHHQNNHPFFNQNDIIDILRNHQISDQNISATPESAGESDINDFEPNTLHSDHSSISSGCDTNSLATNPNDSEHNSIVLMEPVGEKNDLLLKQKTFKRRVTFPLDGNTEIVTNDDIDENYNEDNHIDQQLDFKKTIFINNFAENIERDQLLISKVDDMNYSRSRGGCNNDKVIQMSSIDTDDGNHSEVSDESGYIEEMDSISRKCQNKMIEI